MLCIVSFIKWTKETANILNNAKSNNNKIISVGTTTTRTLETIID
jgi:S-adenosylmethionine:tRNA ribosyltransferase-isomerase